MASDVNGRSESALQALVNRKLDFPTGYFGCCGRSKARGHAELCPRAEPAAEAK